MLRPILFVLALAFTVSFSYAEEDKVALIEEVLRLTRAEETTRIGQLEGFKSGFEMSGAAIPADKKAKIIAAGKQIMGEVMPWSVMKKDFIEMYDKHCTVEDLKTIIALCKDPKYKTLIAKQIELIGPSIKIGQKYGKLMMPKMMESTTKIMQEP